MDAPYFEVPGKGMERPMQTICGDSFSGWGRKFLSLQSIDFAGLCVRNKLGSVHAYGRFLTTHVLPQIASNNHSLTFLSSLAKTFVMMHDTFWWFAKMTIWHDMMRSDMISYDRVQKYPKWYHHSAGLSPIILVSNKVQNTFEKSILKSLGIWRRGNDELTVVVKGFPDTADEATLTSHFAACGEVVRVAWFASGWPEVMTLKLRTYLSFVDINRLQMYRMCVTSPMSMTCFAVRKFCRWPWSMIGKTFRNHRWFRAHNMSIKIHMETLFPEQRGRRLPHLHWWTARASYHGIRLICTWLFQTDSYGSLSLLSQECAEVKVPRHRDTGNVKGTAFVEMKSEEAFNQALVILGGVAFKVWFQLTTVWKDTAKRRFGSSSCPGPRLCRWTAPSI